MREAGEVLRSALSAAGMGERAVRENDKPVRRGGGLKIKLGGAVLNTGNNTDQASSTPTPAPTPTPTSARVEIKPVAVTKPVAAPAPPPPAVVVKAPAPKPKLPVDVGRRKRKAEVEEDEEEGGEDDDDELLEEEEGDTELLEDDELLDEEEEAEDEVEEDEEDLDDDESADSVKPPQRSTAAAAPSAVVHQNKRPARGSDASKVAATATAPAPVATTVNAPTAAGTASAVTGKKIPPKGANGARNAQRRAEAVAQVEIKKAALVERLLGRTTRPAVPTPNPNAPPVPSTPVIQPVPSASYRYRERASSSILCIPPESWNPPCTASAPVSLTPMRCAAPGCAQNRRYLTKQQRKPVCSLQCYRVVESKS